ncbi:MAG: hypothetical protein IPO93_18385 [Actinobacteria bacterium]|nr:hypothetical protein [Actinomycetota bacterium]
MTNPLTVKAGLHVVWAPSQSTIAGIVAIADWNKPLPGTPPRFGVRSRGEWWVHEFDSDLDPEDDQSSAPLVVLERIFGTGRVSPVGTGISDMLVALWDAAERVPVDPPGGERSSGSTSSDIPAPNPLSSQ